MQISIQNSATDCKQTCFPDKSASSATLWQFICYECSTCFSNSIIFRSASRFLLRNSFSSSSSLLLIPSLSLTILSKVFPCSPTGSPSLLFRGLNRRFMLVLELLSIFRREPKLSCLGSVRLHSRWSSLKLRHVRHPRISCML